MGSEQAEATQELWIAFNSWQHNRGKRVELLDGYFSFGHGTNFVVLGLTKDNARLKVCLVDA